jgi:hypothetical protein
MHRRQVLAALGATGVGGCLGARSASPAGSRTTISGTTETPTGDCPPFPDVDRVVCGVTDAPIVVTASPARADLPDPTVTFTLRNRSDRRFAANYYGWSLRKHVDGDWYRVAPRKIPEPLMHLEPGDSHEWRFPIDSDPPIPRRDLVYSKDGGTLGGLGPGAYAFDILGTLAEDDAMVLATPFELDGDPVALHPSPDAHVVASRGDELHVRDGDGDTTTVVKETDADPDRRLVTEQCYQFRTLRNTLGFLRERDATRVRLVGDRGPKVPLAFEPWQTFEYQGSAYQLREAD